MKTEAEHEEFVRNGGQLESAHEAYLIQRHGTIELDPVPSMDPNDPLNWPPLKKNLHLLLVAVQCMMTTFMAAGMIPAYHNMAEEYGVSVTKASYLTSAMIAIMGVFPMLFQPLTNKYGRRPFLAASALGVCVFNIGGGFCKTYSTQMVTRCFAALFISPAAAVGSAIVTEVFMAHERGTKNGMWALLLTLGAPGGPFIMGFVVQHAGVRWIFWIYAIMAFIIFIGWLFADETLYNRALALEHAHHGAEKLGTLTGFKKPGDFLNLKFTFTKKNDLQLSVGYFLRPLKQFANYRVFICVFSYAVVFAYASIVLTVELPQYMQSKFGLDAQSTGLQFLSIIIGSVIGELLAGPLSDFWMKRCIKRRGYKLIEDRLWISYNGYICVIFGLIIWGVRLQQAPQGEWNVTPLIGCAFAAGGNQIVTTALITYVIDVDYTKSAETGLFLTFVRQVFGFIGPFYMPPMFETLGLGASGGLLAGLVGALWIPVIVVHYLGWRRRPHPSHGTIAASA